MFVMHQKLDIWIIFRRRKQIGPPNELRKRGLNLFVVGHREWLPGDQDQIPPGADNGKQKTHGFPQKAFGAVALYSPTHRATGGHTNLQAVFCCRACHQYKKRVRVRLACASHPLKISGSGQTEITLHPCLLCNSKTSTGKQPPVGEAYQ